MKFTNITEGTLISELYDSLEPIFSDLIRRYAHNVEDHHRVKLMIIIEHPDLDCPVIAPLKALNEFSAEYVVNQISAVVQSHQALSFTSEMSVTIGSITYPRMSGREHIFLEINKNRMSSLKNKKFIKVFDDCPPSDKNCMMRAVCYGYFANKEGKKFWNHKKLKRKNFDKYASQIGRMCGVPWDTGVSVDKLDQIENSLQAMLILFKFNKSCTGYDVMYSGNTNFSNNKIYVLVIPPYDSVSLHCVAVTDPHRLFWANKFCQSVCYRCNQLTTQNHACHHKSGKFNTKCYNCEKRNCKEFISGQRTCTITCKLCSYSFLGESCYYGHLSPQFKSKKSLCQTRFRCMICYQNCRGPNARDEHVHGMKKCPNCKTMCFDSLESRHICHLTIGQINNKRNEKIISFDIECAMDAPATCSDPQMADGVCQNCRNSTCTLKIHRPLALVSFSCCEMCRDRENTLYGPGDPCKSCGWRCSICSADGAQICSPRKCDSNTNYCGTRRVTFLGPDCIKLFVEYLLDRRRADFSCYAHNMSGYDGYLILQELERQNYYPKQIIMSGSKVIYFKLPRINIEFYDSLKILCVPLKSLPKALLKGRYSSDIEKQKFPMRMLSESSLNYVGEYPSEDQYITERMSQKELSELRDFLASKKGETFDMKQTVISYCSMDAYILYLSLLSLQDLVMEATSCAHLPKGCDPLRNCITISSLALKIFRQVYLKEYHLATLHNTVTDEVVIVNAVKQGDRMTFDMPNTGSVILEDLFDHELVTTHLMKTSLRLLPPVHFEPYKRNRYSKDGLAYVLYYESKLVEKFGRDNVKSFHVLEHGEKAVHLDKLGTKAFLDGLFYVQHGGKEIVFGTNYHGCWSVSLLAPPPIDAHAF